MKRIAFLGGILGGLIAVSTFAVVLHTSGCAGAQAAKAAEAETVMIAKCPSVYVYLDPGRIVAEHTHGKIEDVSVPVSCVDFCGLGGLCTSAFDLHKQSAVLCDAGMLDGLCVCQAPEED